MLPVLLFAGRNAPAPVELYHLDVYLGRWTARSNRFGLVLFDLAEGRRAAGMVFQRIRVNLFALAMESRTKVFLASSAASLSIRLARARPAPFPGDEKAQSARGRVVPVRGDPDDRHMALDAWCVARRAIVSGRTRGQGVLTDLATLGDFRCMDGLGGYCLADVGICPLAPLLRADRRASNKPGAHFTGFGYLSGGNGRHRANDATQNRARQSGPQLCDKSLTTGCRGRSMDSLPYRCKCRCDGQTRSYRIPLFEKKCDLVSTELESAIVNGRNPEAQS